MKLLKIALAFMAMTMLNAHAAITLTFQTQSDGQTYTYTDNPLTSIDGVWSNDERIAISFANALDESDLAYVSFGSPAPLQAGTYASVVQSDGFSLIGPNSMALFTTFLAPYNTQGSYTVNSIHYAPDGTVDQANIDFNIQTTSFDFDTETTSQEAITGNLRITVPEPSVAILSILALPAALLRRR